MQTNFIMNITPQQIEELAYQLRLLGSPLRLKILYLLSTGGEKNVMDLQKDLTCEQSLMSHQLIKLKDRKVLLSRREGKLVYYRINPLSAGLLDNIFHAIEIF